MGARGASRRIKPPSPGAAKAVSREARKSSKPLSGSAKKAIAGRYEKQAEKSDEGRRRSASARAGGSRAASGGARSGTFSSRGPGFARQDGPREFTPTGRPVPGRERGLGGDQIEGRQAVRELLVANKRKVRELWIASDMEDAGIISEIADLAAANRVQITEVNRRRLDASARSEAPQGVLARAVELEEADFDELLKTRNGQPPFLLAVDGVTDPGNLGALLRTAEGAGVTGVVLPKHRSVHITPTVAKSAAGAIEHLEIAVVPGLPAALAKAQKKKVWVIGLDDAADKTLFDLGDLATEPIIVVLGAEGAGLSRLVRERCDMIVSIPMAGRLSSLNVSTAGALALYEVRRQRLSPS
jgi:23S rRNA (guanosine2251-2'-O)-methyltransferase